MRERRNEDARKRGESLHLTLSPRLRERDF